MKEIYTFSTQSNSKEWRIVNDGVMGGLSRSSLKLTEAGHGQFSGHVSLANSGGFASVQLSTTIKRSGTISNTKTRESRPLQRLVVKVLASLQTGSSPGS